MTPSPPSLSPEAGERGNPLRAAWRSSNHPVPPPGREPLERRQRPTVAGPEHPVRDLGVDPERARRVVAEADRPARRVRTPTLQTAQPRPPPARRADEAHAMVPLAARG